MGAWGSRVFENDTACDFASTVAEAGGLLTLEEALDRVLSSQSDYLEAAEAAEGLAAAEIIARLKGSPGDRTAYTASVDTWIERLGSEPPEALVEKAQRSVARILAEPSELLELWKESPDFEAWKRSVEEVAGRLQRT